MNEILDERLTPHSPPPVCDNEVIIFRNMTFSKPILIYWSDLFCVYKQVAQQINRTVNSLWITF